MIPPLLEQLEKKLRAAAACRRYQEVTRLATEFGQAVRAYAQSLPKGDRRAAEAARSTCLAELRRVTTANRYASPCGEPRRAAAIHLDA